MKKTELLSLLGRIFASIAFIVMFLYGFVSLFIHTFSVYDMAVLKINFFVSNPAQSLWNLIIIIAFFTFVFWIIWNINRKIWFLISGFIFFTIGVITFILLLINDLKDTERLVVGLSVSLLLIINGTFWFLTGYWMEKKTKIEQNIFKKKIKNEKTPS